MTSVAESRPIKPLPKRRLRSRLSEDAQSAILSPAKSSAPAPLFYLPYPYPPPAGVSTGTVADLHDSSEDEPAHFHEPEPQDQQTPPARSTGVEPYDWSENTNNKKKRKIPTPAHPGGSSYSPQTVSPNTTPRNRWKTQNLQRSPLSNLSSGSNSSVRRVKRYPGNTSPTLYDRQTSANYAQSPSPSHSLSGEYFSEDDEEDYIDESGMVAPSSHFTFACHSPVTSGLAYPHPPPPPPLLNSNNNNNATHHSNSRGMSTKATQTSPNLSTTSPQPQQKRQPPVNINGPKASGRRREYTLQQQRLRQRQNSKTQDSNNNNGEIWICEFCEYEAIFGVPPMALMRQYDIKDRRARRKEAERQRLLEKAKAKGKKKKGLGKNTNVNANAGVKAPLVNEGERTGRQDGGVQTEVETGGEDRRRNGSGSVGSGGGG